MGNAAKSTAKGKRKQKQSGTGGTPKKARARKPTAAKVETDRVAQEVAPFDAEAWMPTFLEFLVEGGHVRGACSAASIGRSTAYRHRGSNDAFAEAWDDAVEASTERLEEEAYRRAHDGLVRTRYDKDGNIASEEIVYSDTLMIFLLKARNPEKYRERLDLRHSGAVRTPRVDLSVLSKKELDQYETLSEKLTAAATKQEV